MKTSSLFHPNTTNGILLDLPCKIILLCVFSAICHRSLAQTSALNINAAGQVGIGTTSQTQSLEVQGNIKASGIMVNGFSTNALVPSGVILLWSGSAASIPTGWIICDGNNNTPNLVNRFVLGASTASSIGGTGGNSSVVLALGQIPAHSHNLQGVFAQNTGSHDSGWSHLSTNNTNWQTTTAQNQTAPASSGPPAAVNIMPPYYLLCYIMKK